MFERAYRASYATTVRVALGMCGSLHVAEEIAQDAWSNTYRRHQSSPLVDVVPYVHRAVFNGVRSLGRRNALVRAHRARDRPSLAVDDKTGRVADGLVLTDLLQQLPVRMRTAVVLRIVADPSVAHAAAVMDISEGAVKSATSRGLDRLRELHDQEDHDG